MKKSIVSIFTIISLIVTFIVAYYSFDNYIAKASDVKILSIRLDNKILNDNLYYIQQRIWLLIDRYNNDINKMPTTVKEEYRSLILQKKQIELKLKEIKE